MNPIVFALRRPYAVLAAVVALVGAAGMAWTQVKVDTLPSFDLPVIYVAQPVGGMDPAQLEGLIAAGYEASFQSIAGMQSIESKSVQNLALLKLQFRSGTDMARALAETSAAVHRAQAAMPPGTVPPLVMRYDTGSVPIGYLVLSSDTRTIGAIQDQAFSRVGPMLDRLPGVAASPPFGGNQRTIVVNVDPDRLRAYQMTPDEVVNALAAGNTISPSGNIRIHDQMPMVPVSAMVLDPQELGSIPVRKGSGIFLRNLLGTIEDSSDTATGHALVNGRRAVYLLVTRQPDASSLAVINEIQSTLPKMQAAVPEDIQVSFVLDQSPAVTQAVWCAGTEALLGALVAALLVLLFLRDWRSALVVVLDVSLALLAALVALWLTGQSINLMTLSGLALAVGFLINEAIVEVDSIHVLRARASSVAQAVRLSNAETALPRLLALLCVFALFIPSFFLPGATRSLFVPLALAAGFALVASYVLCSTLLSVLLVYLEASGGRESPSATTQQASTDGPPAPSALGRLHGGYASLLQQVQRLRWLAAAGCLAVTVGFLAWWFGGHPGLGTELFPTVDSGHFQLRLRAATGTRIERTEELALQALEAVKELAGPDNVAVSVGYVGTPSPNYPGQSIYQWTTGPEEALLRVSLKPGSGVRSADLKNRLRLDLPRRLGDWLRHKLQGEGMPEAKIAERVRALKLSFEPADIVNEALSFGSPTPIEVAVSGPRLADNRAYAEKLRKQLEQLPALRDLQFAQSFDYPTLAVTLNRDRAAQSDVSAGDVARSLAIATSSSRFLVHNSWLDPHTGTGYQVQVQVPTALLTSARELEMLPVGQSKSGPLLLRDLAQVEEGTAPGAYHRHNMERVVSLTANFQGEDLGRVTAQIAQAVDSVGDPPRGVTVAVRGLVPPMQEMFAAMTLGLALAVGAVFLLLTAYFQSLRLALIVLATAPAVLAGAALALIVTRTTLNIESFAGVILALGLAVTNAILLVALAEQNRRTGMSAVAASVEGATRRLRPLLMTTVALSACLLPLALALGTGSEPLAPLARAALGGLIAAALATLFVLPALFALLQGARSARSASLDPEDPHSANHVG